VEGRLSLAGVLAKGDHSVWLHLLEEGSDTELIIEILGSLPSACSGKIKPGCRHAFESQALSLSRNEYSTSYEALHKAKVNSPSLDRLASTC
jgi:hypothetical protein